MRILRCDINGFGALYDYHIDFSSDVTCIVEENGFGKTTLAAFIKAMFFGMPTARKNSSTESSDRARYNPWSAPYFGGQLVFSLSDKEYRIVRKFDAKSPTRDEFRLIDEKTGFDCTDFSENIGEELFGINEEAFSKSTFSNGNVNLDGLPVGIRAKISSSVNVGDDLDSYDVANKRLKDAYKAKKKQIDTCLESIQKSKNAIETLKRDKAEYLRISEQIALLSKEQKVLENEENRLIQEGQAIARLDADALKKKNFDEASEKYASLKNENDTISQKYKNCVPDSELSQQFSRVCDDNSEIKILLSGERQKIEQFSDKEVFARFENKLPSDEEISRMKELEKGLENSLPERKAPNKAAIPLVCALLAVSIALYSVNSVVSVVITIICAACLFVLIALTTAAGAGSKKLESQKENAKKNIKDFLAQYYPQDNASLASLISDKELYEKYYLKAKNRLCELEDALRENLKEISDLLEKIGYSGENRDNLINLNSEIKRDSERYILLKKELSDYKSKMQENYDEAAFERLSHGAPNESNAEKELYSVRDKIKVISDKILEYRRNLYTVSSAQENLNEQEQNLENESENLEKYKKQSEIIVKTAKLLEGAKNELFKKYAGKVMLSFDKYTGVFFGENNGDFAIGNELDVTVKRENIARAASLFSEGQQSVIDVCLRLSLVDAMFEKQKPFLILDDPFYALDDENFRKASALIREISKDTQVIYLTCHTSRKI